MTRRFTAFLAGHHAAARAMINANGNDAITIQIGKRKGTVYPPTMTEAVLTRK